MPQTFAAADAVELAVLERNGFIESRHVGIATVLAPDGTVAATLGDADALILPRSSLKPVQALACLSAGVALEGEQLAVAAASHSGTDRHVALVRDMLHGAGLSEEHLQCPPAWPGDQSTRDEMLRDGSQPARIRMTCSGKHAAMLLTCMTNGWSTDGYLDPAHPLQLLIREVAERLVGERFEVTASDGCGAPVFSMSLGGLARAMHRIGTSSERSPFALHRSAGALVAAVRAHPWAIDGPGQADTLVIQRLGVFSKGGAEGVKIMVAPDGTTAALKMLDGSGRAATVVALALLQREGALSAADVAEASAQLALSVHGGEAVVGAIRPAF